MAKEWNTARGEAGYDEQVYVYIHQWNMGGFIRWQHDDSFDELVTRYEEPDARNRWDSPLFTVIYDDADVPGDKMWDAVILRKPPPPNQSTISVSVMDNKRRIIPWLLMMDSRNPFRPPTMCTSSIKWHWRLSMLLWKDKRNLEQVECLWWFLEHHKRSSTHLGQWPFQNYDDYGSSLYPSTRCGQP